MNSVPLGSQHTVEFTASLPFSQHSPTVPKVASTSQHRIAERIEVELWPHKVRLTYSVFCAILKL